MKNPIKSNFWHYSIAVWLCTAAFANFTNAQVATGGNYTLTQTAIASGGASGAGASANGNYSLEGTIGQTAAGTRQPNASYVFQPGFWTVQIFAPTAGTVAVGGRILTPDGGGVRNVRVTMTGAGGEIRTAYSSSFGYFRFENVAAGETYIFSVFAKKFTFSQPSQIRSILEDTDDLLFMANGEN
jgi:hypothetical protein